MNRFVVLAAMCLPLAAGAKGIPLTFATSDGVTIHGDLYEAPDRARSAPLILLFHQGGGDARGEYQPLVARLSGLGYHLLAIDQRRGGDRFGNSNRTVAGLGDREFSYCEAYPDLAGALRYARDSGFTGKIAAWGSSYSAALVFRLAAEHPDDVDAVLAFSPASGEPMQGCRPESYSEQVAVPVLALRPAREMEVPSVPPQMRTFEAHGHATWVADPGVHGSSMLNESRVGAPTDATWAVVTEFLAEAFGATE